MGGLSKPGSRLLCSSGSLTGLSCIRLSEVSGRLVELVAAVAASGIRSSAVSGRLLELVAVSGLRVLVAMVAD